MPFGSPFLAFHWPYCTLSQRGKQWPNRPLSHFSTGCPPGKHLTIAPNPGTLKGRKEGCLVETERAREAISHWAQEGESFTPPAWEDFPTIPLYMDQVILYLGESLELFQREESASLLTSSMINNYVKNGLIPHPEKKKYRKEHLAGLIVLCLLKQVLPIPDVKALFSGREMDAAAYQLFRQAHNAALENTCRALENTCRQEEDLQQAALLLAVEAAARRSAAQRVLRELEEAPGGKKSKAKPQPGEKP